MAFIIMYDYVSVRQIVVTFLMSECNKPSAILYYIHIAHRVF